MDNSTETSLTTKTLLDGLRRTDAYPHRVPDSVVMEQTHISIVFLAGEYAYKVKKPVKTDFLDYSTLERRKYFCEKEVQLDSRYASDLYLGVVPITQSGDRLTLGGDGEVVDYAVKMRRFPSGSLLSKRSDEGKLTTEEITLLARTVAAFHATAKVDRSGVGADWPDFLNRNFRQVLRSLQESVDVRCQSALNVLEAWSDEFFSKHIGGLTKRVDAGFIRECHGDLHLDNVVHWGDRLIPFDGIEFNEHLRWIDVLCDAAFLAMDLAAHNHLDLSGTFINAYLESTGDYQSLELLRLFLVYRSLVRGMTASMKGNDDQMHAQINLANRFTLRKVPTLWITHGVSGSGKTTLSESIVQRHQAIRLRSDVERKRLFGLDFHERPSSQLKATMYASQANEQTYQHLGELAHVILKAGYSVIVDATFLRSADRKRFHEIAKQDGVGFAILDCHSDLQTVRQRIVDRATRSDDASDADLKVLEQQLSCSEPLSCLEQTHVIDIPETNDVNLKP